MTKRESPKDARQAVHLWAFDFLELAGIMQNEQLQSLESSRAQDALSNNAPPATSRGAQITDTLPDGFASVPTCDWLAFTVFGDVFALSQEWLEVLGGGVASERAALGYSHAWVVLGSGRVLCNPARPEMGCHISLPSSALRRFGGNVDALVSRMLNEGGKVTRLDVAVDTRNVPFADVKAKVETFDGLVTHFQRWHSGREGDRHAAHDMTLYLGSQTSDAMVRWYDKAREKGLEGVQWVRFEVQLRRERAHQVLLEWFAGGSIAGMLRGIVDFRIPDGRNQARWAVAEWWTRWIGAGDVVRFVHSTAERILDDTRRWVENQVAPSLALLFMADGGAIDFYKRLAREGAERLKPWQLALLPSAAL